MCYCSAVFIADSIVVLVVVAWTYFVCKCTVVYLMLLLRAGSVSWEFD